MAKRCRSCCAPPSCGPIWIKTNVCDPNNPSVPIATAGISVVLKNSGGTTVGTQVSSGIVTAITLGVHGTGYTSTPTVTLGAPPAGGVQATAACVISGGTVAAISITDPGSGYTTRPTVAFSGGGGSGATATTTLGQGTRFIVTATDTYTFTASYSGYRDVPGTITLSSCASTANAAVTMVTNCTSMTGTLHATDSIYGAFTIGSASGSTASKSATGTVITNCTTLTSTTGAFGITYKLFWDSCNMQLQITYNTCGTALSGPPGMPSGGQPPIQIPMTNTACGGAQCTATYDIHADLVVCSPLMVRFTIPPSSVTFSGVPYPYNAGATITLTP